MLATSVAAIVAVALIVYALFGGADFGGGVWDALASGPRKHEQRRLIASAISPIWETNHVWLILVVVLLFVGFPMAFARLSIVLHIPLTLGLVGIVLRGSAFVFRAYGPTPERMGGGWGTVFGVASIITPLFLGVSLGAVTAGHVVLVEGSFAERFVRPWMTPYAWAVGVFTLVLFAYLAAVYSTVVAREPELREDFRRRALGSAVALFVVAYAVLVLSGELAPSLRARLASPDALPLHAATAGAGITAVWALWTRRFLLARAAAALQAVLIIGGALWAQLPWMIPPDLSIAEAAAPAITLKLVLIGLGAGSIILVPSLAYLFRVFRERGAA
jgi:cytochrome d ubiquinol oxidase subunit II